MRNNLTIVHDLKQNLFRTGEVTHWVRACAIKARGSEFKCTVPMYNLGIVHVPCNPSTG